MMGKIIYADELQEIIKNSYEDTWEQGYVGGFKDACVSILDEIDKMQSAEPTQCNQCKSQEIHTALTDLPAPHAGQWVTKRVKVMCPGDCWWPESTAMNLYTHRRAQ